jgi:hypothetical protein
MAELLFLLHTTKKIARTIRARHRKFRENIIAYFSWYDTHGIEKDTSKSSPVFACVQAFTESLPNNDKGHGYLVSGLYPSSSVQKNKSDKNTTFRRLDLSPSSGG